MDLTEDPFVLYNFHHYDPQVFTHQKASFSEEMREYNRTVTYPGDISGFEQYLQSHPEVFKKHEQIAHEHSNDISLMKKLLEPAFRFSRWSGHDVYCGEFGVISSAPPEEALKWILDVSCLLDAHQIGHALWNYKSLDFGLLDLEGNVVSKHLLDGFIRYNQNRKNTPAHDAL